MISCLISIPHVFSTGAIFTEDQKDSSTELAFKYAVFRINKDKTLLPKTTLVYDIQYVPKDDSFHASKKGKPNSYFSPLARVSASHLILIHRGMNREKGIIKIKLVSCNFFTKTGLLTGARHTKVFATTKLWLKAGAKVFAALRAAGAARINNVSGGFIWCAAQLHNYGEFCMTLRNGDLKYSSRCCQKWARWGYAKKVHLEKKPQPKVKSSKLRALWLVS